MGDNGRLPGKRQRFIAALLTSRNVREAAKAAQIGETTAHRWLADPRFQVALSQAQDQTLHEVERVAVNLMSDALRTLAAMMSGQDTAPAVKVAAAKGLLEHAHRLVETAGLAERLGRLERRSEGTR